MSRFSRVIVSLAVGSIVSLAAFSSGTRAENAPGSQPTMAPLPEGTIARTFVLLVLSDNPPKLSPDDSAALQEKHLAHIASMSATGKVLVAGPFANRDDESLRGALIFSCAIDEARGMASEDPAVKAGRLKVVCMSWRTSKAAMIFPAETPKLP